MISIFLLSLLFMPPADEMLQFMDESGLINVYLIVISFLVSPVLEEDVIRYEAEIEASKLQGQLYRSQLKQITSKNIELETTRIEGTNQNQNKFL